MSKEHIKQLQSEKDKWKSIALKYQEMLKEALLLIDKWKEMYREVTKQ